MGCGAGTARAVPLQQRPTKPLVQHLQTEQSKELPPVQSTPLAVGSGDEVSTIVCSPRPEVGRSLQQVNAEKVDVEDLKTRLHSYVPKEHLQADKFRKTLLDTVEMLAGGCGGVILAIVDKDLVKDLQVAYLDNGLLMMLCRQVCANIHDEGANFEALLRHFCMHSSTDRWQQHELESLAGYLPKAAAPFLAPLEGNPKDGAFIFSHSGTVVAAAGHLRYSSELYQLLRADGRSCGTRHAAALALAEWLGTSSCLGAVFVRSDAGGVHAIVPQGMGVPPLAVHFDSVRHVTQQEMLRNFRIRIIEHGRLMHKVEPGMIRPGVRGERVVTCVNGRVLSEVLIADDTSMVIRANTESKELYVLSREKFEENWEPHGEDIKEGGNSKFRLHKPKPGIQKWIYKVTAADLELVPTGCFEAAWGAMQPLREGDFLAMPAPEERATEVYLMDPDCVSCYAPSDTATAVDTREQPVNHRTQPEMLTLFKEHIIRHGRLMYKVEPCMSRPGKRGERVVTCVTGRITSDVVIQDDTSMVVRAPTMDQELYVLTRDKFLANWLPEPAELDQGTPVNRLLAVQGFKLYKPKPSLKWAYTVTEDDAAKVPSGWFFASWGALQPLQAGDCLAMPAPEDRAKEVYLMPMEVLTCYKEVTDSMELPGAPNTNLSHCTQEEMVHLFAQCIREHGRLVIKARPGMMRPGRRGDRVVTYVNGRVISDVVISDDTSMVVRAPTVDHEEYVLPREKFEANWEPEGELLDAQHPELAQLHARGFRLHQPKKNKKLVYRLAASDLELVPTGWFYAAWGALQPVREGDFLAMPACRHRAPEVYLMPQEVLNCYVDCLEADEGVEDLSPARTVE